MRFAGKRYERLTLKQYKCRLWLDTRDRYVNASTFIRIVKRPAPRDVTSFLRWRCGKNPPSIEHIPAVAWGLENEGVAFAQARKHLARTKGWTVEKCGRMLRGYVAGTPDGICRNHEGKVVASLEIKCPYSTRETGEAPKYLDRGELSEGNAQADKYMAQMQAQMYVSHTTKCCFYVYTPLKSRVTWIKRQKHYDRFFRTIQNNSEIKKILDDQPLLRRELRPTLTRVAV